MNKQIELLTFSIVLLVGFVSYGADVKNGDKKPTTISATSAAPNMQQSANKSQQQNNKAGALSKIIGVAHVTLGVSQIATGSSSTPVGTALIAQGVLNVAMGAQAFQQAGQHGGAAQGSALTGLDTSAWNNPFGDPNAPNPLDPKADPNKDKDLAANVNLKKFVDAKNKLLTSGIGGIKIDPKTGKIIDTNSGKSYDPAALDQKGMADAGFSGSDISAAMGDASKIEKAALAKLGLKAEGIGAATAANGYAEGSGSTGTMGGGNAESSDSVGSGRGLASSGGAVRIPSNQIAGLTKNFNGERIGVSAENIFNMMTRRYKTKEKQNTFFDPSELVKMPH